MINKLSISQAILHITYVCTHHCPMCYANAGKEFAHPPLEDLCNIIDKLVGFGINDITLVGGDPAKYPDILSLVRYIKKKGGRITVLSNTLDFNSQNDRVTKYVDVYEGTIHHSIKEKHDCFCGCIGAYAELVKNLKIFSLHGKSVGLAINLIPYNHDVIYDIVKNVTLAGVNLDHIIFQRIIPFGRAAGVHKYELSSEMLRKIMPQIEQIEEEFKLKVIFEDPLPMCAVEEKYQKYMHPCEWGLTKISVDYVGNLSRCGADVSRSFGTIFDEDVFKKWERSSELNCFKSKSYLPPKCQSCKNIHNCGGGCPISQNPQMGFSTDYLAHLSCM